MPLAEQKIWYFLRNRRLKGHKFVRELPIGPYIADFVCREKQLIIEIDGGQHMDAMNYDQKRTEYLETKGYKVIRFWNNDVLNQVDWVLESILEVLEAE